MKISDLAGAARIVALVDPVFPWEDCEQHTKDTWVRRTLSALSSIDYEDFLVGVVMLPCSGQEERMWREFYTFVMKHGGAKQTELFP